MSTLVTGSVVSIRASCFLIFRPFLFATSACGDIFRHGKKGDEFLSCYISQTRRSLKRH